MIGFSPAAAPGLAPVEDALDALRRRRGPAATRGLAPGLVVPAGAEGWAPFTAHLDDLLQAPTKRWGARKHAAAALAWRAYTYWLAIPVVLTWVTTRAVLLLDPSDVLVRPDDAPAPPGSTGLLTLGLRRVRLATPDREPERRAVLRSTVREAHIDPLLAQIQLRVPLGTRTLLGSLASAVAYAVVRGVDAPPEERAATAADLLATLGVADLVRLRPGPAVQRRTCCLAFTLPEPKICSGCCLRSP